MKDEIYITLSKDINRLDMHIAEMQSEIIHLRFSLVISISCVVVMAAAYFF